MVRLVFVKSPYKVFRHHVGLARIEKLIDHVVVSGLKRPIELSWRSPKAGSPEQMGHQLAVLPGLNGGQSGSPGVTLRAVCPWRIVFGGLPEGT
jgi:hypothetical protein